MTRPRRLAAAAVAALLSLPLPAATSFSGVVGMGYMDSFAYGSLTGLPSSVRLEQGVSDLNLFDDTDTSALMEISFGLEQRNLRQDPETGAWLGEGEMGKPEYGYSSFYSAVGYTFRNELIDNHRTDRKALTIDASANLRFEQAFDSFANIRTGHTFLENHLAEGQTSYWTSESSYAAIPDLRGSAYMMALSLSADATWDDMYRERGGVYREGFKASGRIELAPWFLLNRLPSFFDTEVDYYKLSGDATWSKVLYSDENWKRWNVLSVVFEDRVWAQFLFGGAVPKFADTIEFPGIDYTNAPIVLQNQAKLYVYGPHFLTDNTLPYGYVFLDCGLAAGKPNNSVSGVPWSTFFYIEPGLNVHLEVMGALHVYGEVSYVFSNIPDYGNFFDWGLGFYFAF